MHTVEQINDIVRGIDAVTVLGTRGLGGEAQQALEIDAIAVYLATQIATLKDEAERDHAILDFSNRLQMAVDVRLKAVSAREEPAGQ
jgi:hypothetical protein